MGSPHSTSRRRRALAAPFAMVLATAALAGGTTSQSSAEEDLEAQAPVALVGVVQGVESLAPESVKVQIQPDQQQLEAHARWVSVEQSDVPAAMVETSGDAYTVRIDPAVLPAEVVSDTGIVTFDVFVQDPDVPRYSVTTASVRAVLTISGQYAWTDPLGGTVDVEDDSDGESEGVVPPSAKRAYAGADSKTELSITKYASALRPVRVVMPMPAHKGRVCNSEGCAPTRRAGSVAKYQISSVDDGGDTSAAIDAPEYTEGEALGGDCPHGGIGTVYTNTYRSVSTTIGTAYPIGDDSAWMTHTSGSSSEFTGTFGIGFSDLFPFTSGTYSESGTKSREQSSGFDWDPKGYSRSFRVRIAYRKVEGYYGRCPGDDPYWVKWEPHHYTGGYGENTDGVTRPDWGNCERIGSTGTWWRSRSDGSAYSYSAGVKFAGTIGIDLSSKRSYNSEAKLAYRLLRVGRRMCGNNNDPAIAGKVMEKS